MRSILFTLAGLVVGALAGIALPFAYVAATYRCERVEGNPCDAGAYVAIGLAMLLAPLLGVALAALGWRAAGRLERTKATGAAR
jgi:hypothetical protein